MGVVDDLDVAYENDSLWRAENGFSEVGFSDWKDMIEASEDYDDMIEASEDYEVMLEASE